MLCDFVVRILDRKTISSLERKGHVHIFRWEGTNIWMDVILDEKFRNVNV
jgi:hypothetical protein